MQKPAGRETPRISPGQSIQRVSWALPYFLCPPSDRGGGCALNWQIKNPEIQPAGPLALAGAVLAAHAAGLVEMEVIMCLGVVLICLACVSTRLLWVLNKATTPVEKQLGLSAVYFFLPRSSYRHPAAPKLCEVGASRESLRLKTEFGLSRWRSWPLGTTAQFVFLSGSPAS